MNAKFCPECGRKLEESYKFCPECGFSLTQAEDDAYAALAQSIQEQRKQEAEAQFRKSVLAVAEAFFAMSKEEREAMVEYVQERCDEAEAEAEYIADDNPSKIYN